MRIAPWHPLMDQGAMPTPPSAASTLALMTGWDHGGDALVATRLHRRPAVRRRRVGNRRRRPDEPRRYPARKEAPRNKADAMTRRWALFERGRTRRSTPRQRLDGPVACDPDALVRRACVGSTHPARPRTCGTVANGPSGPSSTGPTVCSPCRAGHPGCDDPVVSDRSGRTPPGDGWRDIDWTGSSGQGAPKRSSTTG